MHRGLVWLLSVLLSFTFVAATSGCIAVAKERTYTTRPRCAAGTYAVQKRDGRWMCKTSNEVKVREHERKKVKVRDRRR